METIFIITKNSKTNEPHKFVLNLSQQRLDFRKQIKLLLFKIYLFVTRARIQENSKVIWGKIIPL